MKTILLLLALTSIASAFPAKLRWNKNAPEEGITEYRIYQTIDGAKVLKHVVPATQDAEAKQTFPIDVQGREVITLTAFNGIESDHSDPVTVPVKPSKPGAVEVVEIQVSSNMTDWETLAFVPLKTEAQSRFVRARMSSVTQ